MQKKLMAVAIATALGAPAVAMAQNSTVQIYGSFNLLYYQHTPNNPGTAKKGDIMEMSEPEIGFRGEEKLGGGMSAWFQCNSSFDAVGGNDSANSNGFCGRNSALGLKGNFGNVFAGNWDMPQKLVVNQARGFFSGTNAGWGGAANLLYGQSASGTGNPTQSITASPRAGTTTGNATAMSNNAERFYRRQAKSINYHSPSFGGVSAQVAYSATNETTGIPAASSLKPRLWSAAVQYEQGPLWLGLGYELHQDFNPGNNTVNTGASQYNGGDDKNWTLGARYTFANKLKLSGLYSQSTYEPTNAGQVKKDGYALFMDWNISGPHSIRAAYSVAKDVKGNSDVPLSSSIPAPGANTGGKVFNLVYGHALSKRTEALAFYNRVSNDSNARYTLGKTTPTLGANQKAVGIGMRHRF